MLMAMMEGRGDNAHKSCSCSMHCVSSDESSNDAADTTVAGTATPASKTATPTVPVTVDQLVAAREAFLTQDAKVRALCKEHEASLQDINASVTKHCERGKRVQEAMDAAQAARSHAADLAAAYITASGDPERDTVWFDTFIKNRRKELKRLSTIIDTHSM